MHRVKIMIEVQDFTTEVLKDTIASGELQARTADGLELHITSAATFNTLFFSGTEKHLPALVFVSGTSESGKSTMGKIAVENGLGHRLKIYKTLAELVKGGTLPSDSSGSKFNPFDYASWLQRDPSLLQQSCNLVAERYVSLMASTKVSIAVVETIKHPWMITEFAKAGNLRLLSLYIDADLDLRVRRQAEKTDTDIEVMRQEVLKKDEWKRELGSIGVKDVSDGFIQNNGSYQSYDTFIKALLTSIKDNSQPIVGKTEDYS